jgi:hypothetical protein
MMTCDKEAWPDEACLSCKDFHVREGYAWNPFAVVHCFNRNETKYGKPKNEKEV